MISVGRLYRYNGLGLSAIVADTQVIVWTDDRFLFTSMADMADPVGWQIDLRRSGVPYKRRVLPMTVGDGTSFEMHRYENLYGGHRITVIGRAPSAPGAEVLVSRQCLDPLSLQTEFERVQDDDITDAQTVVDCFGRRWVLDCGDNGLQLLQAVIAYYFGLDDVHPARKMYIDDVFVVEYDRQDMVLIDDGSQLATRRAVPSQRELSGVMAYGCPYNKDIIDGPNYRITKYTHKGRPWLAVAEGRETDETLVINSPEIIHAVSKAFFIEANSPVREVRPVYRGRILPPVSDPSLLQIAAAAAMLVD